MQTKNIYHLPIDINKVNTTSKDSIAHVGDLIHSIDFDAPEGTPIYAAFDGLVISIKDDSNKGGEDQKFEDEISKDQLGDLPFDDLFTIDQEFEVRTSKEAIIAKDADLIDQILLLKEYVHQGNKEAEIWLSGKGNNERSNVQYRNLKTESAKILGQKIMESRVSEWWENIWTSQNR